MSDPKRVCGYYLVSECSMCIQDEPIFLNTPSPFLDARVQVIVPPFPTLLANPTLTIAYT